MIWIEFMMLVKLTGKCRLKLKLNPIAIWKYERTILPWILTFVIAALAFAIFFCIFFKKTSCFSMVISSSVDFSFQQPTTATVIPTMRAKTPMTTVV